MAKKIELEIIEKSIEKAIKSLAPYLFKCPDYNSGCLNYIIYSNGNPISLDVKDGVIEVWHKYHADILEKKGLEKIKGQ